MVGSHGNLVFPILGIGIGIAGIGIAGPCGSIRCRDGDFGPGHPRRQHKLGNAIGKRPQFLHGQIGQAFVLFVDRIP